MCICVEENSSQLSEKISLRSYLSRGALSASDARRSLELIFISALQKITPVHDLCVECEAT